MFFYLIYNLLDNKFTSKQKNKITIVFGVIIYFIIHMFLFTGDRYDFYQEYIYFILLCDILMLFIKRNINIDNKVNIESNLETNNLEPFKNDEIISESFYNNIWIKNTNSKLIPELHR